MGEANWTVLGSSVSIGNVRRGVTAGSTKPNGGGTYVYGFNSVAAVAGTVGLYTNQANFIPTAEGGSIRAAVMRGPSASPTGFSPFLFIGGQGTSISDNAYMLGLSDASPSTLVLRKGALSEGIVDGELGDDGILAKSTDTFDEGTWYHFRFDMIVNPSGDVVLRVYQNDLGANAVTAPVWALVDGLDAEDENAAFIDDALGVNSGSLPYSSGYMGYGFQVDGLSRRSYFDHVECLRQI